MLESSSLFLLSLKLICGSVKYVASIANLVYVITHFQIEKYVHLFMYVFVNSIDI